MWQTEHAGDRLLVKTSTVIFVLDWELPLKNQYNKSYMNSNLCKIFQVILVYVVYGKQKIALISFPIEGV